MHSDRRQYRRVEHDRQSITCRRRARRFIRFIALAASVLWWTGCGGPPRHADESLLAPRPVLYETDLPYPLDFVSFDLYRRPLELSPDLRVCYPTLHIDSRGLVTDITCGNAQDSSRVAEHRYALEAVRFEPGRRRMENADMLLPVAMLMGDTAGAPEVVFPVDRRRRVNDATLYFEALARNGVVGPQLDSFPSYFFKTAPVISNRYPFKLYRVDIDTAGRTSNVVFVKGDSDTFNDQLTAAIRRARCRPATIDGVPRAARAFLLVSLFPQVKYPTGPWASANIESMSEIERTRVRLVADTVGLMQGAIPQRSWSGEIRDKSHWGYIDGEISAFIHVDTAGRSRASDYNTSNWKGIAIIGSAAFRNRFFPARTWAGDVVATKGLVSLRYLDESSIRIRFEWLR